MSSSIVSQCASVNKRESRVEALAGDSKERSKEDRVVLWPDSWATLRDRDRSVSARATDVLWFELAGRR